MRRRAQALIVAVAAAAIAATVPSAARAEANGEPAAETASDGLSWSYLVDGGAVPFVFGSAAVAIGLRLFVEPPEEPRGFSEEEGGAEVLGDTVPEAAVAAYAVVGAAVVGLAGDRSRWFHLKGFAEATLTTVAMTEVAKNAVGRRRPHWSPAAGVDARRSFFSGHSSVTFATSTYLVLYYHQHIAPRLSEGDDVPLWAYLPSAALVGGSVAVAASRVRDNRHHASDVIAGAVVGTLTSTAFYYWQEYRYQRAQGERGGRLTLSPWLGDVGATVSLTF